MHKLILLALFAGLAAPAAWGAPRAPITYRVSEDEGLRYAQVISSRPAYRQVRVAEMRQECGVQPFEAGAMLPMGGVGAAGSAGAYGGSRAMAVTEHCRTITGYRYEQRIEGYDVTYHYQGRIYTTRMPYDPGSRVPVRVEVHPLRN